MKGTTGHFHLTVKMKFYWGGVAALTKAENLSIKSLKTIMNTELYYQKKISISLLHLFLSCQYHDKVSCRKTCMKYNIIPISLSIPWQNVMSCHSFFVIIVTFPFYAQIYVMKTWQNVMSFNLDINDHRLLLFESISYHPFYPILLILGL